MMKRIAFYTLGCKVNQVETEQMIEQFTERGYQVVEFGDPADVCVINTCTVTHISDRKSRAMLRRAIRANPEALVVAAGCVAQVDAAQLARIEGIGLIIGNQDKENIADIVDKSIFNKEIGQRIQVKAICPAQNLSPVIYSHAHQRTRAFVKIQDVCQSFCSYCIVPFARGPVRSKTPADVIAEIRQLLLLGYREIVLTGIHTGLYGLDIPDWNLNRLLEKILAEVTGDYRLRLSSIEPLEVNDELLNLISTDQHLCRHLHIPLQSGSNRILKSMRRRYSREYYRDLIQKASALIPGTAFTADVMVGYPTESEADFINTYDLINELPIFDLHVFPYSPRAGTSAAVMEPQVPSDEKHKRSSILLELGRKKKINFMQSFIGKELRVLVERQLAGDSFVGISDNYIEVHFSARKDLLSEFVQVTLTEVGEEFGAGVID